MVSLDGVTQTGFDSAESVVLEHLRNSYPDLDLRRGTVLREQLVRPAAQLQALNDARVTEKTSAVTLADLMETTNPDTGVVNALLSNFNLSYNSGALATGNLKLYFTASSSVLVPVNTRFTTAEGLGFLVSSSYLIAETGGDATLLESGDGRFYAIVAATADTVGVSYNIPRGTQLTGGESIAGFVSAFACTSFVGGSNAESVTAAVARIKPALAQRSLSNTVSVLGLLRDRFGDVIRDVSLQGFAAPAQWRNRANLTGIGIGGYVDAYIRTFTGAPITVLVKAGTLQEDGTYRIELSEAEAPGFYAVRSITDDDGTETIADNPSSSYRYSEQRQAATTTLHSLPTAKLTEYSVYQTAVISVLGITSGADTRVFKLELYCAPYLADIQTYVDSASIKDEGTDFLVKSPLMCLVSLRLVGNRNQDSTVTGAQLGTIIASYINSRGFTSTLSLSELVHVVCGSGISSVSMRPGDISIEGRIRGAGDTWYLLTGDTVLDLAGIDGAIDMVTDKTVVFVCDPCDIQVTVR